MCKRPPIRSVLLVWALALLFTLPPVMLQAAVTVTEKLAEATTTDAASYTTAGTFSLAASTMGLCFTAHRDSTAAEVVSAVTHDSASWTSITNVAFGADGSMSVWRIAGSRATSAITIDITGADPQSGMIVQCYELAGSETAAELQIKTGTSVATMAHTLTMDAARTTGAVLFHQFSGGSLNASRVFTAEYAGVGTQSEYATPDQQARVQWVIGGSDTTPLWTSDANTSTSMIAVEIAEASAGGAPTKRMLLMGVGDGQ